MSVYKRSTVESAGKYRGSNIEQGNMQQQFNTVKPLNIGHRRVWSKLSAIWRCALFGGLVKIFNV